MTKIIAVDFDGTLCKNAWPDIGPPNFPVLHYILHQQSTGAKIILWTCRKDRQLDAAVQWCKEHNLTFDAINENLPEIIHRFGGDCRKVYADEYLDDKAIRLPEKSNLRRRRIM